MPLSTVTWGNAISEPKSYQNAPQDTYKAPKDWLKLRHFRGPLPITVTIWTPRTTRTVLAMKAKKFKELVEGGETIKAAVEEVGVSLGILRKNKDGVGKSVQEVLDNYGWIPTNVRKEYAKAALLKVQDMAMDAAAADPMDSKLLKVALEATKALGEEFAELRSARPVAPATPTEAEVPPALAGLLNEIILPPEPRGKEKDKEEEL